MYIHIYAHKYVFKLSKYTMFSNKTSENLLLMAINSLLNTAKSMSNR